LKSNSINKIDWKKIWNNRKIIYKYNKTPLEKLMLLNGHQFSSSGINISNWKNYANNISKKIKISKKESIFEYGCGSGALLYLFKFKAKKIMGCDYSLELIRASKKIFPQLKIIHVDCAKFKTNLKFDHVISSSMLEYVKPGDQKIIIKNMLSVFKKTLFIGEILNKTYENNFLKKFNKEKNYYNFINKSYFIELCKKNDLKLKILPSLLPNSRQKYYRYSVLIKKK
tara:strand:+ start:2434 stop:3114 length:681 start_codon:yes stop_codon:yes gene_type:complete